MPNCPNCGHHLAREHRRPLQKLVYSDILRCGKCGYRAARPHWLVWSNSSFFFSRYTTCIRCGNGAVRRGSRRDRVDTVSKHPFSGLFHLLGAPVVKCSACRLQYYDWRPPRP